MLPGSTEKLWAQGSLHQRPSGKTLQVPLGWTTTTDIHFQVLEIVQLSTKAIYSEASSQPQKFRVASDLRAERTGLSLSDLGTHM